MLLLRAPNGQVYIVAYKSIKQVGRSALPGCLASARQAPPALRSVPGGGCQANRLALRCAALGLVGLA
jgi:hypothetical protein